MMGKYAHRMRFFLLTVVAFAAGALLRADISPQQRYVDRYAALAVTEMDRSGEDVAQFVAGKTDNEIE